MGNCCSTSRRLVGAHQPDWGLCLAQQHQDRCRQGQAVAVAGWRACTCLPRRLAGHLIVDDYAGYKALFVEGITELACLAHVWRKFFELHATSGSPIAAVAMRRMGLL